MKKLVKKAFKRFGLEVHRVGDSERASLTGALKQLKNLGFEPCTVIDVGAAYGEFTMECHSIFPKSRYIMVEPLKEYASHLNKVIGKIASAEYVTAAASSKKGQIKINVHPDLVGSSTRLEEEDSDVNGFPRTVKAETVDTLCMDNAAKGPYLLKVDVQGAELDVLDGCRETLERSECVILEVSFFRFFKGGPQFYDVVEYMKRREFVVYDIFSPQYRPLDGAMSQADVVFVREEGIFRKYHFYVTKEQRKKQMSEIMRSV